MDKKRLQLGMNPSTANGRLVKDLLWKYIPTAVCHRCGEAMTRDNFSIEHIKPWLDSDDPIKMFFDLDNITFSHHSCNSSAARRPYKKWENEAEREAARIRVYPSYDSEKRRDKYLKYGK